MEAKNYKFVESHEWINFLDEETALIGITEYAQNSLGDIVFVNLPEVGSTITLGTSVGDLESVKAVSDFYTPVSGEVLEVNEELLMAPELINQDAYGTWFIKVGKITETEKLLSYDEYEALEKE